MHNILQEDFWYLAQIDSVTTFTDFRDNNNKENILIGTFMLRINFLKIMIYVFINRKRDLYP